MEEIDFTLYLSETDHCGTLLQQLTTHTTAFWGTGSDVLVYLLMITFLKRLSRS